MLIKIDHIGIAVRSIERALVLYRDVLGLRPGLIEEVPEQKTRVAMLPIGDSRLELLEAMTADSPVGKFIDKRGEGVHHLCFQVEDIRKELQSLRDAGLKLIDDTPRIGAEGCLVAFIHPSSTGGVLIEISQPPTHETIE